MAKHRKQKSGKTSGKALIAVVIVLCAAAVFVGGYFLLKHFSGKEVNVYSVDDLSMNYAWATESQTDGRVTTDKIQSVYISSTQQITEIYVEEGQTVSIGDPLLAFDTTLSELELDRQSIKVSQLELDIQEAEKKLAEIDTYKVGSPSYSSPTYDTSYSEDLVIPNILPCYQKGIGTTEDPMVYLWNDTCSYDEAFIAALVERSAELKAAQQPDVPEPSTPPTEEPVPPEATEEPTDEVDPPAEPEPTPAEPEPTPEAPVSPTAEPVPPEEDDPETPQDPEDPCVYVVFEVRDSDALNGTVLRNWEMAILMAEDGTWVFQIVEPDYEPEEDASSGYVPDSYVDDSVYYSATEIAQMKAETKQKIIDLKLELKMANLEYERLAYELSNGIVYSTVDGEVKTLRDPEEARSENEPVLLVSGGGGYYITAAISELELASMHVGDTVSVQSWENYNILDAEIVEISEYPDESGQYWHYSEGNQNVSLYPFRAFVNEDANLREGEWVTVTYTPGGEDSGEGFYVQTPFVRKENGKDYVYTLGENGRLEKRFVTTGGNLWGSYVKILDGLTTEDYIAFPYGRSVEEGAKTRIAEIDELYSY